MKNNESHMETVFSLADLAAKAMSGKWRGEIRCGLSDKQVHGADIAALVDEFSSKELRLFGERVLVVIDDVVDSINAMLAVWAGGGCVIPVQRSTAENPQLLRSLSEDAEARWMIDCKTVTDLGIKEPKNNRFIFQCGPRRVTGSELALIIYTSGSTSSPKGIMLTHGNVMNALHSIASYLDISDDEVILSCMPVSFDYGLYQVLFSLLRDCKLIVLQSVFNPLIVAKKAQEHKATLLPGVPSLISSVVSIAEKRSEMFASLVKITNTGGHLAHDLIVRMMDAKPGVRFYPMYGLTECKRAMYMPPDKVLEKPGSVGIPIPGLEAVIFEEVYDELSKTHKYIQLPPGQVGELYVRGSTIMQGYCRHEDNVGSGVRVIGGAYRADNWLATGDLFAQDEEGFFYFKGRAKALIKQGGYCIYVAELEDTVMKHVDVKACAVRGETDRLGNEIAALYISMHDDAELDPGQFQSWLKQTIEKGYMPQKVEIIEEVPLLPNGKINIAEIPLSGTSP